MNSIISKTIIFIVILIIAFFIAKFLFNFTKSKKNSKHVYKTDENLVETFQTPLNVDNLINDLRIVLE